MLRRRAKLSKLRRLDWRLKLDRRNLKRRKPPDSRRVRVSKRHVSWKSYEPWSSSNKRLKSLTHQMMMTMKPC